MKNIYLFLLFLINCTVLNAQSWEPIIEMDNNIFPSYILSTSGQASNNNSLTPYGTEVIGDQTGLIGVKLSDIIESTKIKLEILENDYLYESEIEETIDGSSKIYYLFPKIKYKFENLRSVNQQRPANIEFKVTINNNEPKVKVLNANIRSLEECPFIYRSNLTNQQIPITWMFAAYVNEDSPLINEILSDALSSGIVNRFAGYQSNEQEVENQVFAIWYSFQKMGIKYSNITNTSLNSTTVYSQRVRMIDQSYKNAQANCVDGTVLFASVLKAIGIDPILVLIPGHMFLGYYLDESHKKFSFLETTMIGSIDMENLRTNEVSRSTIDKLIQANKTLKEINQFQIGRTPEEKRLQIAQQEKNIDAIMVSMKKEASQNSFISATNKAIKEFNNDRIYFNNNVQFQIIDVAEARKKVMPIWR